MKTFRLFISSTFSDFKKERQILQLKVFPEIKKYCLDKGYKFQPIDLRWGVSNEAQLDQKTLELCLNEVRTCKSHPHPNFLVMIGDRYGWIPLPYIIEKVEFENLLAGMNEEEKILIYEWYREDLNQIPVAYILQSRINEFVDYDVWQEIENKLRTIMQKTVEAINLSEEQKRKYYLSATEAEVEEGIIPYHSYTEYQKQLISKNPSINEVDSKYIFGFLRDSEATSSDISDNGCINAQQFKNRVKQVLSSSSIFYKRIHDVSNESYLSEFEERVIAFLKSQIDSYEVKTDTNELQKEIEAQAFFAQQKRNNFLAQETLLEAIASYIVDANNEPLVIYGPSGRGKSSVMAKAIEAAENTNRKVCYRFIGATPHSSSTKEVMISIFDQLGINIQNNADETKIDKNISSLGRNKETFEKFSYRIYDAINALKEDVVIFIDAVDQLVNDDQFLWLPAKLPENVKIIISALNDSKYVEDSQYFKVLKNKTNNLIEIPVFSEPIRLLRTILNAENRTLQPNQEAYFLEQFNKVQSPLYVIVSAQELKHWRSYDTHLSLADTQHGIIEEFIENLSSIYHHKHAFVHKVLAYIYASRDGLSEDEILQLISTDKEFVKQVAPEHFHTNERGELPLVIWTRLYTQLKPFLSSKYQDGEELLYFFYREFEKVISQNINLKIIHSEAIFATSKKITQLENLNFTSYRWGKVLGIFILNYSLNYTDNLELDLLSQIIDNESWYLAFIEFMESEADKLQVENDFSHSITSKKIILNLIDSWLNKNSKIDLWIKTKIRLLHKLEKSLTHQHQYEKSYKVLAKIEKILQPILAAGHIDDWFREYIDLQISLSQKAYVHNNLDLAIEIMKPTNQKVEQLFKQSAFEWSEYYSATLNVLASILHENNNFQNAIDLYKKELEIIENYKQYFDDLEVNQSTGLNNLAIAYSDYKKDHLALPYSIESYSLAKKLFYKYPKTHIVTYSDSLKTYAHILSKEKKNNKQAEELYNECYELRKQYFNNHLESGLPKYLLILNDIATFYLKNNQRKASIMKSEEFISVYEQATIDIQQTYFETYIRHLNEQIKYYKQTKNGSMQKSFLNKKYIVFLNRYGYFSGDVKQIEIEIQGLEEDGNKIERNDPCPCGSGKKYKKCCGKSN
ncbi:MAG: ATP-binding protein [Sulfurimonas sp.]|uniref:DUF4062 domain-containing protein n=1 Tax=Sulfurimonas sp. TaxID=2022749 RepID=UPI003D146212